MSQRTMRASVALLAASALVVSALPASGVASGQAGGAATATLDLRAQMQLVSTRGGACPPGSSETTECPSRTGSGPAPGLGTATVAYTYLADLGHPACLSGSVRILGYPVRFAVAGKGELQIAVTERAECLSQAAGISVEQAFTITGGTGAYAGATGSGTVNRSLGQTNTGAAGIETWVGTLTVPGLEFDTARPTFSGVANKVVRAKRGAKTARVAFRVTAQDDREGAVTTRCTPASGAKFKIGRTRVTCTATDSSANSATASFTVIVRKTR